MEPLQVFVALLKAAAGVTALAGARTYPLELPQATAYPALVVSFDNDDPLPTIDATAAFGLRLADVDVVIFAKSAASAQALKLAVEAACNFQRGAIGGVNVVSIGQASSTRPDFNSRLGNWFLTLSFPLTYRR